MNPRLRSVAFTAARDLDVAGAEVVVNGLVQVPDARQYITGGARGGDSFIGRWLCIHQPHAEHVIVVPANRSQVDPWWEPWTCEQPRNRRITVLEMRPGTSYEDRNDVLVALGAVMYGFPAWEEPDPRSLRSGTWQTIRKARQAGTLVFWSCVMPPYRGRIERNISDFLVAA